MVEREYAIKTVKAFIEACKDSNIFFKKVLIFGSVAAGTTHKNSDIDVALVSDQFTGFPFADWHLLSPINISFPDIEPHPYTTEYFKIGDPLIEEIKRTGFEVA
jgi:predicted nucleotidyltransferase